MCGGSRRGRQIVLRIFRDSDATATANVDALYRYPSSVRSPFLSPLAFPTSVGTRAIVPDLGLWPRPQITTSMRRSDPEKLYLAPKHEGAPKPSWEGGAACTCAPCGCLREAEAEMISAVRCFIFLRALITVTAPLPSPPEAVDAFTSILLRFGFFFFFLFLFFKLSPPKVNFFCFSLLSLRSENYCSTSITKF